MPQRRNARSNRARILATARQELGRNPDITLEALAEEAAEALQTVAAAEARPEESAERALAHFTLVMWPVGDRHRNSHLPPAVLSAGLEGMTVALLEQINTGALEDDGVRVAVATLIAAGVPEEQARVVVDGVAATVSAETVADG